MLELIAYRRATEELVPSARTWEATMRRSINALALAAVGFLAFSVPLFAHHGSAVYETAKTVTVKGTVTQWVWANPHCILTVDAKDESGNTTHWVIENQAPSNITNYGWSKFTFKAGDEVVVDVTPGKTLATSGTTVGRFEGRVVINGKPFKNAGER
jgi:hypothetical protein